MLTLINTNLMRPPIAPVGLEYVAGAARRAGIEVDVVDLCLVDDREAALRAAFARRQPGLVGISFRNVDDCFWPGSAWFVPELERVMRTIRTLTAAPVVLGGVGFSIFPQRIVELSGADFGVHGDGEEAIVRLHEELRGGRRLDRIEGLLWREGVSLRANRPAWPTRLVLPAARDAVDIPAYFRLGGQIGVETKRGCPRACAYCADPLAKGTAIRLRGPAEVADEMASLAAQGADVLHLCDSEFNIARDHALAVCEEMIRRGLGERVRWYAYLAVLPFDSELAGAMRRAGCVGINFTADSASAAMLRTYNHPHRQEALRQAVALCRARGIAVMLDLLLGGPGETPETVAESIRFFQQINADCVGAALGVRLYPGTQVARLVAAEQGGAGVHRRYEGPVDLVKPTFYVSPALGERPAQLVRDLIGGDVRFFAPADDAPAAGAVGSDPYANYNYNENRALCEAIAAGARGAYWDILRQQRGA